MFSIKPMEKLVLDDILIKFKLNGFYYIKFISMIFLMNLNDCLMCSDYVFVAEKSSYRCADKRFGNDSCATLSNSTEVCTEWIYDDPNSFVAEFQLACQEWKRTLVGTSQSMGYGVGLLFIGSLSDRLGRKTLILSGIVIGTTMGIVKSFVRNYWCYVVLEFLQSTCGNIYSPAYILMIEIVAHEKRVLTKILCGFGSSVGYIFLPFMAWLVPYWRNLLLILYAPAIVFLSYIYLLDESPRWLLSKGEKDKAIDILENAAKKSKVNIDRNELDNIKYEKNEEEISLKQALKTTFSSAVLVKRFFICLIWWIASTFVGYGLTINSVSLPGNKYINFGLLGVLEVPGKLTTMWVLNTFRRKTALLYAFFISAVFCFVQPFAPESMPWLSILLYFCGQFMATIFFAVTYIFTSELFPTYTRNCMHALCSALGRVGSITAPQTPLLMDYWRGLPSLTFGAVSLLAGCVTLFAPKTASDILPDTVKQAEALGLQQNSTFDDSNLQKRVTYEMKENNQC